jgi:cell division septum initiation protein DivIVA
MHMSDNKGLGRFFKGDDSGDASTASARDFADAEKTIAALQSRITELEGAAGRASFIDLDEDALTQIAAEDAAVIIRAARMRAGKLIEQATETLQQAESEREQIRASCELDARQTREAANVDARKLRAEATSTLETARDQAAQLLEATQNDADSQATENQKVIAKLLEDATRRANEVVADAEKLKARVENETQLLRAATEKEGADFLAAANKESADQIAAAQAEAKRLQTEATNAAQSMIEKASTDARALGETASTTHSSTIAEAQAKLQQAEKQAEKIIDQAQSKSEEIIREASAKSVAETIAVREATYAYRDSVLASFEVNRQIFDDLKNRISNLRSVWFDLADSHFKKSEESVADLLSRFEGSRSALNGSFDGMPDELKAGKKTEDN